jgi:hypothetical protein
MGHVKGGPAWRVKQVWPKAHSLKQRSGGYKIVTGDRATGNQCIGEGTQLQHAWRDAARRLE